MVGCQDAESFRQVGVGQVFGARQESRTATTGLLRTLVRIENPINRQHETPQAQQGWQVGEHLSEMLLFALAQAFGPGDDQVTVFPDEVSLFFLGFAIAGTGALLGLAEASPAFGFSLT